MALAALVLSACSLGNPLFLSEPDGGLEDARRPIGLARDAAEATVDVGGVVDVPADLVLRVDAVDADDRPERSDTLVLDGDASDGGALVDAGAPALDSTSFDTADVFDALDVVALADRIEGEERADVTGDDRRPAGDLPDAFADAAHEDARPAIDIAPVCGSMTMACGGECVDVATDRRHCGVCDRACQSGELCLGGGCTWPRCGDARERVLCGDACVDLATDPDHCGACRSSCAAGQFCRLGLCNGR
ncbi:MAG: hypothetical protein EPO40_08770 [Myxococcaceae bacterium]|nr:MAG: hypothetical protein EPO40_08770 [Myxococcaceae bacterium]